VDDAEKKSGFWTSLPGILTGVAALITAVGGLTLGLYQSGGLGAKHGDAGSATRSGISSEKASTEAASGQPKADPARSNQVESRPSVVVTARDGSETTLFADNFHQTAQYDTQLHLLSGQAIAFDNIRSIEISKSFSDHAQVNITLVDGRTIEGSLGAGSSIYGFGGENELGNFSITVDHLKRIVFRH